MNNSFDEIAKVMLDAQTVLLYPHINMDGDALGSCAALCKALRMAGKQAYILIEESIPLNLQFMDKGYCTTDTGILEEPDLSVCVDCGEMSRFPGRRETFLKGKTSMCLDHHHTTSAFCQYNYIDDQAAAAGEIVYEVLRAMGTPQDAEIGEALFAALTTDTGNFQYSNTTKKSFEIMTDIFDWGVDTNKVSVELYENVRPERKYIESKALGTMELIGGGKGAIAYVTDEMMKETGALPEETDLVVQELRSISGVEYAAFLKEKETGLIRISLRAKRKGDVAAIAEKLGGGGHVKAAGGTLHMPMKEALEVVKKELEESIKKL